VKKKKKNQKTARQLFLVTFSMLAFPVWHSGELPQTQESFCLILFSPLFRKGLTKQTVVSETFRQPVAMGLLATLSYWLVCTAVPLACLGPQWPTAK